MVLLPGRRIRLAVPAGGNLSRMLDKMNRIEKYHAQYAPQRRASKVIAVTPAALAFEQRAIATEEDFQALSAELSRKLEQIAVEAEKSEGGAA